MSIIENTTQAAVSHIHVSTAGIGIRNRRRRRNPPKATILPFSTGEKAGRPMNQLNLASGRCTSRPSHSFLPDFMLVSSCSMLYVDGDKISNPPTPRLETSVFLRWLELNRCSQICKSHPIPLAYDPHDNTWTMDTSTGFFFAFFVYKRVA